MQTDITRAVAGSVAAAEEADPLHRLAAELALTAHAASNGTMGYVVGRSHAA